MLKEPKIRNKRHRQWIASLPCLVTSRSDVQACHIRIGNSAGAGLKSGDDCTVPLCVNEHLIQGCGERKYWARKGGIERATKLAKDLYAVTGDTDAALKLIAEWRSEIYS